MSNEELLKITKYNLHKLDNPIDSRMGTILDGQITLLLDVSKVQIEDMGINLDMREANDCLLVSDLACYLYQKRQTAEDMPRHLKFAIHNRLVKERGNANV